nr:hypothetical protein [Tanacetum cinerariifolium]
MVQRPKLYTKVKSDFEQPSSVLPFRPPFSSRNELVDHPIEDSNCKGGDAAGSGMGRIWGDAGSWGDGICGNRDDNGVSGDGGGIGIAKNLFASSLVKDSVGGWGLKDILAMTRSAGGGGIESAEVGCSSSS